MKTILIMMAGLMAITGCERKDDRAAQDANVKRLAKIAGLKTHAEFLDKGIELGGDAAEVARMRRDLAATELELKALEKAPE